MAVAVSLGCSAASEPPPRLIGVEGCLTASGDDLVLTRLQPAAVVSGAGGQATEMYQLVGLDDELRPLVGTRVRVSGEARPSDVTILRERTPLDDPRPAAATAADDDTDEGVASEHDAAPATASDDEPSARVGSLQKVRFEVAGMLVRAVTPTGERCRP